jgi:hypothetical protein
LGGRWNAVKKGWDVPDHIADHAIAIVAGAGKSKPRYNASRRGASLACRCRHCQSGSESLCTR